MKLSEGVILQYMVGNPAELVRLKKAIDSFPLKIELSDLAKSGDGPRIFVSEGIDKEIIIKPYRCSISRKTWEQRLSKRLGNQMAVINNRYIRFKNNTYLIDEYPFQ
jgi:hypothetical protein